MIYATTILAVRRDGKCAVAGDGQVTINQNTIMKHTAKKSPAVVSWPGCSRICGFCRGCVLRFARSLRASLNSTVEAFRGQRYPWRRIGGETRSLRNLEAMLIAANKNEMLVLSGSGEVIDPDDGIAAIGSGGQYALAAAKALKENTDLSAKEIVLKAMEIAGKICVFTNNQITIEEV